VLHSDRLQPYSQSFYWVVQACPELQLIFAKRQERSKNRHLVARLVVEVEGDRLHPSVVGVARVVDVPDV
jgi:hypothetical protein